MAAKRVTPVPNMRNLSDEPVRSLAPHYYTDPAIFEQERDSVEEDVRLVESVQRGMNSWGYSPGPLVIDPTGYGVNSEHALHTLQTWTRQAVGE